MSGQAYVGTSKRTFRHALRHLLETDYGLVGSHRVLEMLVEDVEQLVDEFYPAPERLKNGWMVFTGTKASGHRARPGQSASDHELVTLAWPVLTAEDVQKLTQVGDTQEGRSQWNQGRLVRLVEYGQQYPQGPVLLTQADLAAMTGLTTVKVCLLLEAARKATGKPLVTKGYYFDQGMRPSHKKEIIDLYEQGLDEIAIARQSNHAIQSVGRYLRDYERVKMLVRRKTPEEQIGQLLEMQPSVVQAYLKMVKAHHPDMKKNGNEPKDP
jgi:hypothetical protein